MQPDDSLFTERMLTPSTIETIDMAMYNYINNISNQSLHTNENFKKVPVIWSGAERSFQIKNNPELRDEQTALIYPLITVQRTSMEKDKSFKGAFQAHFPDGEGPRRKGVPIARRIVQEKSKNFANAGTARLNNGDPNFPRTNSKVVYQVVYAPIPTYVKVMYSVSFITSYQTQMNDLVQPYFTKTGQINAFSISSDGHRYEVFTEGSFKYDNNINNFESDERIFKTTIDFRVLGYLMGEGPNDEKPKFSVYENVVEVKLPRERVITMDKNLTTKKSFFRS